jgi:hypothetical protein
VHALLDYILLVVGSLCIGGFAVRKLMSKSPDLQQVSEAVAKQAEEVKVQQTSSASDTRGHHHRAAATVRGLRGRATAGDMATRAMLRSLDLDIASARSAQMQG